MAIDVTANNPNATLHTTVLTTPPAGSSEIWQIDFLPGPAWPSLLYGQQTRCLIDQEIVVLTGGSTATGTQSVTVTRGAESTTPSPHTAGTPMLQVLTAQGLQNQHGRIAMLLTDFPADGAQFIDYEVTTSTVAQSRDTTANIQAASYLDMATYTYVAFKFNSGAYAGLPSAMRLWLTNLTSSGGTQAELTYVLPLLYGDSGGQPGTLVNNTFATIFLPAFALAQQFHSPAAGSITVNGPGTLVAHTDYWLVLMLTPDPTGRHYDVGVPYAGGDTGVLMTSPDGTTWTPVTGHAFYDVYAAANPGAFFSTDTGIAVTGVGTAKPGVEGISQITDGVYGLSIYGSGVEGASSSGAGIYGHTQTGFKYGATITIAGQVWSMAPSAGVYGNNSGGGYGILGTCSGSIDLNHSAGVGGCFIGDAANLELPPSTHETLGGPPGLISAHRVGEIFTDKFGSIYSCWQAGNPGKWYRIAPGNPVVSTAVTYTSGFADLFIEASAAGITINLPSRPDLCGYAEERIVKNVSGGAITVASPGLLDGGVSSISLAANAVQRFRTDPTYGWRQA